MTVLEWLYRSTLELSLLITLVLISRTLVRHLLNAQVSYWLWLIPLATVVIWNKPERPKMILEAIGLPDGGATLQLSPHPDVFVISESWNLGWIWLAGFVIWLSARIYSWIKLHGLLKSESSVLDVPKALSDLISEHQKITGLKLNSTTLVGAPFVTGIIFPRIYVPIDFFQTFSIHEQRWIVIHELTHVQRWDLWGQLVAELVRACFWFNPIVHLAWKHFRQDQELACDHQALKNCNSQDRVQYGKAMLQGMKGNLQPATLAFLTLNKERFIMLQKHKHSTMKSIMGVSLCVAIALLVLTEAPKVAALDNEYNIYSIKFSDVGLAEAVEAVSELAGKELETTELLMTYDKTLNMSLEDALPLETLTFILKCTGFSYIDNGTSIEIIEDYSSENESDECIALTHSS